MHFVTIVHAHCQKNNYEIGLELQGKYKMVIEW